MDRPFIPQPNADDASTDRFKLTYFAPPEGMERHVLTLFSLEWDEEEIEDRHAGALGQLFFTLRGKGTIRFHEHVDAVDGSTVLFPGFDFAAPFKLQGPWHCLGASLSALGWAALVQLPAQQYRNRFHRAGDLLGEEIEQLAEGLKQQCLAGTMSREEACYALADWMQPRFAPLPPQHEVLIERTMLWLASSLNPALEELFEAQRYSRKQVERLVLQYFGFTPAALARKYRAIRAAAMLAREDLSDAEEAAIAAAFFDQPHMVHEIRRYCGYTPSRLGGEGEPLFQQLLRMKNLDRFKPFRVQGTSGS